MNAVIYARYSSHAQTEQSIEGQLHDNHAWAMQHGIKVVGEYVDRALTGTKDARPDFQRMIADAAKMQFELVIVWKLDRFARNRYDSAVYKAKLKKYGVRVVSVKENISDAPEGIILEGLLESLAEYYSANLSQNIKRGQRESIAKGRYCGGKVPYGYKAVDGKLLLDEKTAPYVRYIFEQYAAGTPKREILATVNERGMRNSQGGPVTYASFTTMLKNPIYIGNYVYKGQVVPGIAQQLIDEETFKAVQRMSSVHARTPGTATAKVDYLLSCKAFCGHCGAMMIGVSGRSKTGAIYYYYQCGNRNRRRGCRKKNERKDFLEWYVVEQTLEYVLNPVRAAWIAQAVVAEYDKEFSDHRIEEYERALKQIERELDKLVDALIDTPKVAHSRIYARMEELDVKKTDLELDLSKLRIANGIRLTEDQVMAWLKQFTNGDPSDEAYRRRIIDTFINSIFVYDDRVVIFYNIRGGKQISYIDVSTALDELDDLDELDAPDPSSQPSESSSVNRSAPPGTRLWKQRRVFFCRYSPSRTG